MSEEVAQKNIDEQLLIKMAEERLRETEAKYKAFVTNAVDPIITIDEKGQIESTNPSFSTLFGYDLEEVLGKNVKMLMPDPYQSEHDGYLARYRSTGQKKIIGIGREVIGRKKSGDVFPMHLSVCEYQTGGRRYFTGVARDMSALEDMKVLRESLLKLFQIMRGEQTPKQLAIGVLTFLVHNLSA